MSLRRPYIDWLRGFAVLTMIEWHVLDGWTVRADRPESTWLLIETIGGFAAPLFLFLAGVAIPMAIGSQVRKGRSFEAAAGSVQKRGWQIFGIALLFRFQSFLLYPYATWSGIFRPDILNILGLGLVCGAWLSGRAMRRRNAWWLIVPAVLIFALTPFTREWWWPSQLPGRLEAYIRPNGLGVFQIFPWLGYVPFGALLGLLLQNTKDETAEARLLSRFAIGGLVAAAIGVPGLLGPYSTFFVRCGLMTFALAASKWVVAMQPAPMLRPILRYGQTSLFIYIVHVELAYGVWSYPIHNALPLWLSLLGLGGMYVLMYFAAGWWESRARRPWIPSNLQPATSNLQGKAPL